MSSVAFGRPYVTPADFGARGDGITDDRAAIQAAIDHCGGTLFIPRLAGDYMLSDVLQLPSNITLIGIGNPCLKLLPNRPFRTQLEPPTTPNYNAAITNADHVNGNHHIRLIGLKLDGNLGNPANPNQIVEQGGRGANLLVVLLNQVSFFEIADCELTGGISECIYALGGCASPSFGTTHGIISNCFIHDTGQPDVDSLGCHGDRVDGMSVSGCTFQNIGLRAIGFSKGTNVAVSGCTTINCQDGILLGGTRYASFSGCTFTSIRNDGCLIDQAADGQVPLCVSIAGCMFRGKSGNTGHGMRLKAGNFIAIGTCSVDGFLSDGFLVETGENSLVNVVASNCTGHGIKLSGSGATKNAVGPYHVFNCTLGDEAEESGAANNKWRSAHRLTFGLFGDEPSTAGEVRYTTDGLDLYGRPWSSGSLSGLLIRLLDLARVWRLGINGDPDPDWHLRVYAGAQIDGDLCLPARDPSMPVFTDPDKQVVTQPIDLLGGYLSNCLPVSKGGTSCDTAAAAIALLMAAWTGVLGVANGGTGCDTAAAAIAYLMAAWTGVLGVANGGTGADNVAGARAVLDVYSKGEVDAAIAAALADYVTLTTYNAHGHWFGVPGHAHGGVKAGTQTSGDAGAYGDKTGGPY
jgi:hypothetical protein